MNMLSISHRVRIWGFLLFFLFALYTGMYATDNYATDNWRILEQQHQRIISTTSVVQNRISQVSQQNINNNNNNKKDFNITRTKRTFQNYEPRERSFPRWSDGIDIDSLLDAIHVAMSGQLRFDRVHRVYIINEFGVLFQATVPRPSSADDAPYRRAKPMEILVLQVLKYVLNKFDDNSQYPYLKMILQQGGFAYIANYADSKFCTEEPPFIDDNWKQLLNYSNVPIFSLSSPIHCQKAFPLPTYETIEQSDLNWAALIPYYQKIFPRSLQHHQAVWRGGPTGHHEPLKNTRIQLCQKTLERPDLLDAKIVKKRKQWHLSSELNNLIELFDEDQLVGDKIPMVEFQRYRAIIDVDGHSWSSRFGKLLCYSSVILKVEPEDVDYFHPELKPWVHYIPIQSNLSNLFDMASLAVSDDPSIVQIIKNANGWCLEHMNRSNLILDMAHILDRYAYYLLLDQLGNVGIDLALLQPDMLIAYRDKWSKMQKSLFHQYNFTRVNE
jgi:Glycosyl transferase family 90